ncbi:UNVERIFIED_CONTAM: hypothetical protein K2H54_027008 [Gekko kuhli]
MEILPSLFILSVLLATGSFLECEVCSSPGSSCIGGTERCDANEDTCSIISIENSLDNFTVLTVAKDCDSSESCMTPGKSMNLGHGRTIQTYSICCIGDSCAVENPKVVPMENAVNGIQCPACFSTNGSCVTEKINCTGDENYCFEMVSTTKVGGKVVEAVMKGCTTRHVCKAIKERRASPLIGAGLSLKHGSCPNVASGGSQITGLLFPAFSELLLMKMIL